MDTPNQRRRQLLLALGLGGAGAAAALTKADKTLPAQATPAAETEQTKGYRASAHVLNYYRTTKV